MAAVTWAAAVAAVTGEAGTAEVGRRREIGNNGPPWTPQGGPFAWLSKQNRQRIGPFNDGNGDGR